MRIYSIDLLKVLLAFGIIFIHVGTFIVGVENMNNFQAYLYSLSSLFVPLFFVISGFFFSQNKNKKSAIVKLIVIYIIISVISMVINVFGFNITYELDEIKFILIGDYINYLWFINSLIYYMIIVYIVESISKKHYDEFFVFMIFIIICNIGKLDSLNSIYFMSIIYFLAGYTINKFNLNYEKSYIAIPFIITYPFLVNMQYVTINIFTLIVCSLVFISIKNINMRPIKVPSYFAIIMLVVHYYFINLLNLTTNSYIINFLVISILSSIISYVISKIIRTKYA